MTSFKSLKTGINPHRLRNLLLAFIFFPFILLGQQSGFIVTGTVLGFTDGATVKLLQTSDNSELTRTRITKGQFMLSGSIPEPGLYWLVIANEQPQYIFLENKKISVAANKASMKNIKISGSASHRDFDEFRKIFTPLLGELNGAGALLSRTEPGPKSDSLWKVYDSLTRVVQTQIDVFVLHKPSSFVSPFLLFVTGKMYDDASLLQKRYNLLDTSVKKSQIGKALFRYVQYNLIGAIGSEAIDFTQPDTSGKQVTLSSFRGKYVLVDFWASWCGPCRSENPNVVSNYQQFKDKNFTVLGVSLDRPGQRDNWIRAIKDDNLTWTHVSDLNYWQNAAAQTYHVESIPFNMLIDPAGKIIAKNLRGADLQKKLCEILGGCN